MKTDGKNKYFGDHQRRVNRPSSEYGEQYWPTAFLAFEHPEEANIPNIWAGLNPKDIDPGKK